MAAITINRPRDEVERLWSEARPDVEGAVTFRDAPGDRGTEIHIAVEDGGLVDKVKGAVPRAKAKDELRRFKQRVETGEVPRSEGNPDGESVSRKLKQRPAQPLEEVAS